MIPPFMIVPLAVFVAVAATGGVLVLGALAVRLLRLPNDPPFELTLEAPSPEPQPVGDPAAARARAQVWLAASGRGRRTLALYATAGSAADLADWIAAHDRTRSEAAHAAAATVRDAAERARAACTAGDETALAAAEREALTAAQQVRSLGDGLPDLQAAERRKLMLLVGVLLAAVLLAAFSLCLR